MFAKFRGGVHPDDSKAATRHKSIEIMPAPPFVVLPLSMHIGAPCEPLCDVGNRVLLGQKIAASKAAVSAPIHASVSGVVTAIEPRPHPNGTMAPAIVLENDGSDTIHAGVRPLGSVEALSADELLSIVREAGIVGLGGATFPTHVKLSSARGKVDTLLLNGAECEPYITSDHRVMLETPEEVIGGLRAIMKILGLAKAKICVERNKRDAIERLRKTLPRGSEISVVSLRTHYPQGSEKHLIYSVTGRETPSGQLPVSVGVAVFNVTTAAAIHRAVTTGVPLYSRVVTVSGSAVSNPKNLLVRLGTPIQDIFQVTGGFRENPYKVLAGGPMMGMAQHNLAAPVIKGTGSLLAFSRQEDSRVPDPVCIRCGKCVSVCPMRLQPMYMYMYEQKNRLDDLQRLHVQDCIECGSCSYTCPGRLYLVHSFRTAKQKLRSLSQSQS